MGPRIVLRHCGESSTDLRHRAWHSGHAGCCEIEADCRSTFSRRGFLSGGIALGATVASPLLAQPATPSVTTAEHAKPRRIDVHYHIAPPGWSAAIAAHKLLQPVWGSWSIGKAVEEMDRDGVDLSITSIAIPGVWFGEDAAARRLARECNDFAAKLRSDHPHRFGMFGVLPLPDIDGSLAEVAYVMDELKADGIGLLTSYGEKWLGDPTFDPVFAELNRRKALIYTHPTVASCCRNLVPGIPPSIIEYGTDTSRAIAGIVFGGAAKRYPDMRIIFSHAGGTLPFLVERLVVLARAPEASQRLPAGGPLAALRSFYYDTAQASMAPPITALRHVAPLSHILFGTDYPFRTAAEHITELNESQVFTAGELQAIARDNVLALLPPHAG